MQRMDGKCRPYECAWPDCARHLSQREKEQRRARSVQENIRQVVPGWIESVKAAIERNRQPGERMPDAAIKGPESPNHVLPGKTLLNVMVSRDVKTVIERDELIF